MLTMAGDPCAVSLIPTSWSNFLSSVIVVSNDSVNDSSLIDTDARMREAGILRINRASIAAVCREEVEKDDEAVKLRRCGQKEHTFFCCVLRSCSASGASGVSSHAKYRTRSDTRLILCPAQVTPIAVFVPASSCRQWQTVSLTCHEESRRWQSLCSLAAKGNRSSTTPLIPQTTYHSQISPRPQRLNDDDDAKKMQFMAISAQVNLLSYARYGFAL